MVPVAEVDVGLGRGVTDEQVPDEIQQPDDKKQETEGDDSGSEDAESENPE